MKLYAMPSSGNSYKVRVMLALRGLAHEMVPAEYGSDGLAEAHRLSPMGKVPLLVLDDGTVLTESGAILLYLARSTQWLPDDPVAQARVHAWMFWEQNQHESTVAVRAGLLTYPGRSGTPAQLDALFQAGQQALARMEGALADTPFIDGPEMTVADIALYAYTHTAEARGGFDLSDMPALRAWLDRMAAALPQVDLPLP